MQNTINQLQNAMRSTQQHTLTEARAKTEAEVNNFANDGNHPYFDELADEIAIQIKAGKGLQDAYDTALFANPVTRAKEMCIRDRSMMLAISRRFRFGNEIEEHIMAMKPPEKEDPKAAEQAKAQADAQAKQAEMQAQAQMKQAEAQIRAQEKQIDLQAESAKFQSEKQAEMIAQDKDIAAKKEMLLMELQSKERIAENVARIQAETQLLTSHAQLMAQKESKSEGN